MKILIADFDLFAKVGGGQTFYRSIIEKNAGLEFYYLVLNEQPGALRPSNAIPIPFQERYTSGHWAGFYDVTPPSWSIYAFLRASNIAYSAAGKQFDVVDFPDYDQVGIFLRPALEYHGVKVDKFALSLHGRLSNSIRLNWTTEGFVNRALTTQEEMQYQAADVRYGLSHQYLEECADKFGPKACYFSPLRFIDVPEPNRTISDGSRPDICFVGRTEKCKGPDVFVDIAWWLPRNSYGRARMIGPESWDVNGIGSNEHLRRMANNRQGARDIDFCDSMKSADLKRLFASRAVAVLPSRYDTFNLVAAESLLAGCPTAIGSGAGICRFLRDTVGDVPHVRIEMEHPLSCVPRLTDLLQNYDVHRDELVEALHRAKREGRLSPTGPALADVYRRPPQPVAAARAELERWYRRLMQHQAAVPHSAFPSSRSSQILRRVARRLTTPEQRRRIRALSPNRLVNRARSAARNGLGHTRFGQRARVVAQVMQGDAFVAQYQSLHHAPERTEKEISAKLEGCAQLIAHSRLDRIRLWREMARLEGLRGNDLLAATYRLRSMRLAGDDRFNDLQPAISILRKHGYVHEAEAADAMYGAHGDSDFRCQRILDNAYERNRCWSERPFEVFDDRRNGAQVRASIVVSLYNAASQLPQFLRLLATQTMLRAGHAEVILIDSGSPSNERSIIDAVTAELGFPFVYARSHNRETIQEAWNRALLISRGEYVCYLGVDEMLMPCALEVLARELDADESIDWVQSNSLVTNVNHAGSWLSDVMTYNRSDSERPFAYLETCYLSAVGALHRRSIHDRFGFYDPTFRGAGDTEFKNRVLPFIKTKAIPRTLGLFWNYPSERATSSPLAELEDLRAWYLHRTAAGVRYAFAKQSLSVVENLLFSSLRYRKSYCSHWSTDIEYAHYLARFLATQPQVSAAAKLGIGIATLLDTYRRLDLIPNVTHGTIESTLANATRVADAVAGQHAKMTGDRVQPAYHVFNDNRHEQHNHVWRVAA